MLKKRQKLEAVMGWKIAPPRLTIWAYLYGLMYLALPFLLAMLALDIIFYTLFREVWGACYGVMCLFE
ncbi:hypothetical protein [Kordiimonas sp. SCSIO 12610]|uniref:hypothetical protein n=1 Tax=Kordiimonas sp. SCSIO 12610 TaxID=2829597 RepID=UPI00210EB822|nr:hypothetical protein [Kordiimonas sp. SCSIO 12610]UTW55373.1 hypothetical protein KFF44_00325 [Kordiimonas sp. SCSIO 12610]